MNPPPSRYVFGPVPSRRLGRSLGVDLVPLKTCSYDCIYCQLGRTTCRTLRRRDWVPVKDVLRELQARLDCRPDYITLSGSGEPTLHAQLGEIIDGIRSLTSIPIAVLTNGSLLWQPEVREALLDADVVLPSLDAPDAERFELINRPARGIAFERVLEGLERFREEYRGQLWLEVLLLAGYTDLPVPLRHLAHWAQRIRPDRIQLNTAVRPPAEPYAMAVAPERLHELARVFDPPAQVIADTPRRRTPPEALADARSVLALLKRRPCTAPEVARGLSLIPALALKLLDTLHAEGRILLTRQGNQCYYQAARPPRPTHSPPKNPHPSLARTPPP